MPLLIGGENCEADCKSVDKGGTRVPERGLFHSLSLILRGDQESRYVSIPPAFFLGSAFVGTAFMLLFGNEFFRTDFRAYWPISPPDPSHAWTDLALEPIWPFLIALFVVAGAFHAYWRAYGPQRSRTIDLWWAAVAMAALLAVALMFELSLKASFDYHRESDTEARVTGLLSGLLGLDKTSSAPAGWCWRQTWLGLTALLLWEQPRLRDSRWRQAAYAVCAGTFLWTAVGRVHVGRHTLFDVGMSLGVATYLFWVVIYIALGASRHIALAVRRQWFPEMAAYSLLYLMLPFYYARNPLSYVVTWAVLMVTMWMISLLRPRQDDGAAPGGLGTREVPQTGEAT